MKTLAAVLYGLNKPLVLEELEIPSLKEGQVLVKISASGICRSQINEIKGFRGEDRYLPHLLGHEGAGIVVETGKGVTKVRKGDQVVLSWIKGKGYDAQGAVFYHRGRKINAGPVTTFSEYSVLSENRVYKIIRGVPADEAALLGCAYPTGAGIVNHIIKSGQNKSLGVFETGGVGLSVIAAAVNNNFRRIIAVDINKDALRLARRAGATDAILFRQETIKKKIHQISPGGLDFAVEASGNKSAMECAYEAAGDGGRVVIAGNLKQGDKISIDPFGLIRGKMIRGTKGGETDPDRDIPLYARQIRSGKLNLDKLITHRVQFSDINRAFGMLEQGVTDGRIVIII